MKLLSSFALLISITAHAQMNSSVLSFEGLYQLDARQISDSMCAHQVRVTLNPNATGSAPALKIIGDSTNELPQYLRLEKESTTILPLAFYTAGTKEYPIGTSRCIERISYIYKLSTGAFIATETSQVIEQRSVIGFRESILKFTSSPNKTTLVISRDQNARGDIAAFPKECFFVKIKF